MTATIPKIGLTSWRLPVDVLETPLFAGKVGADLLQLDFGGESRGPELTPGALTRRLRVQAEDAGVELAGLAVNALNDIGLTTRSSKAEKECRTVFLRALDSAWSLGVDMMIVPSFRKSFVRDEHDVVRTEQFLFDACASAAEAHISVATENVLAPPVLADVLQRVDAPNLRVLADIGNLSEYGIDVLEYGVAAGDRLCADVHVKDLRDGPAGDCRLGSGAIDIAWAVTAFRFAFESAGFVVETDHRTAHPDAVRADLVWLATVLSQTGEDPKLK